MFIYVWKSQETGKTHPASFCCNYTGELRIDNHFLQVTVKAVRTTLGMSPAVTNVYVFMFLQSKTQTHTDSLFVLLDSMISALHLWINQLLPGRVFFNVFRADIVADWDATELCVVKILFWREWSLGMGRDTQSTSSPAIGSIAVGEMTTVQLFKWDGYEESSN